MTFGVDLLFGIGQFNGYVALNVFVPVIAGTSVYVHLERELTQQISRAPPPTDIEL